MSENYLDQILKNISDFNHGFKMNPLDIKIYSRGSDCPALPICESIGAARKSCTKESTLPSGNIEACLSSLILLISRVTGLWSKELENHVEERRKIGFLDR
jgi:hypothetical protein